jgi:hypothetical protein
MSERHQVEIDQSGYMHWKPKGSFKAGLYREVLPGDDDDKSDAYSRLLKRHAALVEAASNMLKDPYSDIYKHELRKALENEQ